ncbi:MAG: phosphatidate cytidylyltransferase [Paludibacteraceae bacterium]|nr:phosphatidate cytidylyltransferase [Paludibacteraceae bacterium]
MKNFIQRTITGIIFVSIVLTSIYFQPEYKTLTTLFAIVMGWGLIEYYSLVNKGFNIQVPTTYLFICGMILYGLIGSTTGNTLTTLVFAALYILCITGLFIYELYRKKEQPIHNLAFSMLGQVVVALPCSLINLIAVPDQIHWVFALFILIWLSDTGAYLVGCTLGKHKLFERISPKKSWEGFFGGCAFAIGGSMLLWHLFTTVWPIGANTTWWQWLIFAIIIIIFGTYGDLSESLLKRAANIKDSGNILPGHGGILDRFDSLLLCIPVVYIYLEILNVL